MTKILIVEDSEALSQLWVEVFDDQGYETLVAHTTEAALMLIHRHEFDLVLLDVFVGDGSTVGVSNYLAVSWPDIPQIMLTGTGVFPTGEYRDSAGGVDWFLRKPVKVDELTAMVSYLLDRRSAERGLDGMGNRATA